MEEAAAREPRVAIRYFAGCPHWKTAYERVRQVLTESGHGDVTMALEPVASPEDAERLRFVGSPTILLDGEDPFAGEAAGGYGLSCRVYSTPEGAAGSPTNEQLREVLEPFFGGQATI